ncbi:MutS-related protein, partial [Massilia terrae]
DLQRRLRPLRDADTEVAALLYEGDCAPVPAWAGRTWPLPLALAASIAAVALTPFAWLGVAFVLYVLIALQMRYHERVQKWKQSVATLRMLLATCWVLGEDEALADGGFALGREQAGRLDRALSRGAAWLPGAQEYGDWFALANVNHYFKSMRRVFAERDFLAACYERCAVLEADVALARHLQAAPRWCWAAASAPDALALDGAVHPLLAGAAPLSIALDGKGAFISGQNGVGKSTFLRTLGLSLATARAFGFAYAHAARLPDLPLYASMQNEDSLLGGESLYIAELRRARELLQAADSGGAAVFLIDEIFRGTNHVESVSAAAAVLDTLAARGLVLVSSHNVVLASLLARWLDPYRIARDAGGLTLRPGVLVETNGVALLAGQGFAPEISDKAARFAQWLGQRLSEPIAIPAL